MSKDCAHKVTSLKLIREGLSQEQRLAEALKPAYAPVDERETEHHLVFAQAFAEFLNYYDTTNTQNGNWQAFFANDPSALLAIIASQNVDLYKVKTKETFDFVRNRTNQSSPDLKQKVGVLFSYVGSLARQPDVFKENIPTGVPLKKTLQHLIRTQLAPHFRRLIGYYKGGGTLIEEAIADIQVLGAKAISFQTVLNDGLSSDWITDASPDWNAFVTGISPESSVYGSGTTDFEKINHLATHNLFTGIFEQFLKVYGRIVKEAKKGLEASFNQPDHAPHYALFLAFLKLREFTREQTNRLTERHLDFYYRQILQLTEKPAEPAQVHLLTELANDFEPYLLKKGTAFKAGKDAKGNDVLFESDGDLVINAAKVTDFKTVYRHQNKTNDTLPFQNGRLFAAPIANSDNGLTPELTSVDGAWQPFYHKIYENDQLNAIQMPPAEVGFAVASPELYVTEGFRRISLSFGLAGPVTGTFRATVFITTAEGWYSSEEVFSMNGTTAVLAFTMEADAPGVTPYQAEIHGGNFATAHPVVKFVLKHSPNHEFDYQKLENSVVTHCTVSVRVGLNESGVFTKSGVNTLVISTDFGEADVSKPFQPFGPLPQKGNALLIGHKELFQKSNVNLQLKIKWKGLPANAAQADFGTNLPYAPDATIQRLTKDGWLTVNTAVKLFETNFTPSSIVNLLDENTLGISINIPPFGTQVFQIPFTNTFKNTGIIPLALPPEPQSPVDYTPNEPYTIGDTNGFLKLVLNGDFGHKAWQEALTRHLLKVALKETSADAALPVAPYIPEIEAISIGYSAQSAVMPLNSSQPNANFAFFHLFPFGASEQHPRLGTTPDVFLVPQFKSRRTGEAHEAEFYIGIEGLKPPQTLSLLFQVADGTANPLSVKPELHIQWSFLSNNQWIDFKPSEVEDHTGQLLRSGLVVFSFPREASSQNTLLPAEKHWIRAAVTEKSDAVCSLISVTAQALKATFADHQNDPAFSAKPLPAGTITKLDQPVAEIEKVEQPYESFGGRGKEQAEAFYTRVSERLRHKDRAITLWDYEHLVLEAFPQIYKAKCLNHTRYGPDKNGQMVYSELAAGHVTLVTIPNLQFQKSRDPLKPYTGLGVLEDIEAFLRRRLSCFVKLHVANPLFEPVRVSFNVKFREGSDETFYRNRLETSLIQFLSPWAFAGGKPPSFGGKVYKSTLINFVEEQEYVDYLTDFQLFHYIVDDEGIDRRSIDRNEVEASTAISILVSMPKGGHSITVIPAVEEEQSTEKCACES